MKQKLLLDKGVIWILYCIGHRPAPLHPFEWM